MPDADGRDSPDLDELGLDLSVYEPEDARKLVEFALERGATREQLAEAARTGTLGPLAIDLALRPPGDALPFAEAVARAGIDADDAAALWRALGFPDPSASGVRLTADEAEAFRTITQMGTALLGPETALQLTRVMGSATVQIAETVVDAFRLRFEMPQRAAGKSYADVIEDYMRIAAVMFPALGRSVTDVLRMHVVNVARGGWALDEEQAAVTRDRTVGFADLVGYTRRAQGLSPAALAEAIARFEASVSEIVTRAGGRVVKLIGDEAMFVVDDPGKGCEIASEVVRALREDARLPPVRIGLAAGPVVALHGDYYGDVVNLAARLVTAAGVDEVLLSAAMADAVSDDLELDRVELPALKGYEGSVPAFRLRPA